MELVNVGKAVIPNRRFELAYAAGSIGTAIFIIAPQLLLLYFMTETLGIPPGAAGLALLLPKTVEMFTDPLVGRWSDRIDTRWGRRRPFMAVGACLFSMAFVALFYPPVFPEWGASLIWVVAMYTLTTTAFTLYEVPYITMLTEVTDDHHVRTRISGWRSAFLSMGFLMTGGLAPWIVQSGDGTREAYLQMGLIIGLIAFLAMGLSVVGTGSGRTIARSEASSKDWLLPLKVPAFSWLWLAYVIQLFSAGVHSSMITYHNKYWMGNDSLLVTKVIVGAMLIAIATTPAWALLARRLGKYNGFIIATVLYGIGMGVYWFAPGGPVQLWFAVVVMGVSTAGQQLFCMAIAPDVIAAECKRSGQAEEGAFFGIWVMGQKVALAIGAAFAGFGLQLAGFLESTSSAVMEQPPMAVLSIGLLVSLIPAVICWFSLYPIYRAKHSMKRLLKEAV